MFFPLQVPRFLPNLIEIRRTIAKYELNINLIILYAKTVVNRRKNKFNNKYLPKMLYNYALDK